MSDHILKTIEDLTAQLREQERAVQETKRSINNLLKLAGMPARFGDDAIDASSIGTLQGDEFLGKTQIIAARMLLDRRKAMGLGPATPTEIYEGLLAGGYKFDTQDVGNRKRGLAGTFSKNTAVFYRLDNGKIGLLAWYDGVKAKKPGPTTAELANGTKVVVNDEPAVEPIDKKPAAEPAGPTKGKADPAKGKNVAS